MTKKKRAEEIQKIFDVVYAGAKCSLDYTTEHELLVAVQLSAQCTDARVNIVTKELFKRYTSPQEFADADLSELEEYIKSCGFYRNKAKNIIASSKIIVEKYNGRIPDPMEELTALPGVGRKTANLLLGDLYGVPGSVVCDTHCIRICQRLGFSKGKDPEKVEQQLRAILPPEESSDFCHRIVLFGRDICTARNPKCSQCPLAVHCTLINAG